jgi:hypothetical protein
MSPFASLVRIAREHRLPFLVIGGHAVSQLGYSRLTFDLDLLIAAPDRDAWLGWLLDLGYRLTADGGVFLQLAPPEQQDHWPLDLLVVEADTFAAMAAAAQTVTMAGQTVAIPCAEHLLALKLHALSTGPLERSGKDYQDIVGILRTQGLDPRSPRLRATLAPYTTEGWYERILDSFPPL